MIIERFIELLKERTNNFNLYGSIHLAVDILLACFIIFIIYKVLRVKIRKKLLLLYIVLFIIGYGALYLLQLVLALKLLNWLLFWSLGIVIIVFNQEIKNFIDNAFHSSKNENLFSSVEEKQQVINILVNSSVYLSKRRIGALIAVERQDSLNSLIDKAIFMKSILSEELLTTLFFVGTATHDGAVIIRKNRIMCAGAYLPTTDKYEIPKSLGTRHRAAIGLSERYDAITIVISEETGNISLTADGVIEAGITPDELREILERYFIIK